MQVFVRRGFQLRAASFETRMAYTGFLALMVPAVATLIALSFGRTGWNPTAIAAHYRGGDSEMSFPKNFWQLMEVSHFHLFTVPVVVLILSHLLFGTPFSSRVRVWLTVATFTGAFVDAVGPWAVRYLAGGFAYLLIGGWILLGGGAAMIVVLTLFSMWSPERWLTRVAPPPASPEKPA